MAQTQLYVKLLTQNVSSSCILFQKVMSTQIWEDYVSIGCMKKIGLSDH